MRVALRDARRSVTSWCRRHTIGGDGAVAAVRRGQRQGEPGGTQPRTGTGTDRGAAGQSSRRVRARTRNCGRGGASPPRPAPVRPALDAARSGRTCGPGGWDRASRATGLRALRRARWRRWVRSRVPGDHPGRTGAPGRGLLDRPGPAARHDAGRRRPLRRLVPRPGALHDHHPDGRPAADPGLRAAAQRRRRRTVHLVVDGSWPAQRVAPPAARTHRAAPAAQLRPEPCARPAEWPDRTGRASGDAHHGGASGPPPVDGDHTRPTHCATDTDSASGGLFATLLRVTEPP